MIGMMPHPSQPWAKRLGTDTRSDTASEEVERTSRFPLLTILCHPSPHRVGEQAWLTDLEEGRSVAVSRVEPAFAPVGGDESFPLADPRLSRHALRIVPRPDALVLEAPTGGKRPEVDGEPLEGRREVPLAALDTGVVILYGSRVALLLHRATPTVTPPPDFGLVGHSDAILRLRRQIAAVADLTVPVLLRGESGTGKELVAQAIQRHSPRRDRPFHSLNMAALAPNLAAAELFGAVKGAYSGADRPRAGSFRESDGGTLFLDEIGEAPPEVQALLLRALESGEIQPVGTERTTRVDVRILAATDANLEEAGRQGEFKSPLLYRLQGYEIRVPPLRERREDLGRLFFHFLREELRQVGEEDRLREPGPLDRAYVPAALPAAMVRHSWPGNVRELRNAVRRLVVAGRGEERLPVGDWLQVPTQEAPIRAAAETPTPARTGYRDPSDLKEGELRRALRQHRFNLRATAEALGLSRGSLYALIEKTPEIRKAVDLDRNTIQQSLDRFDGSLQTAAEALEVSTQGLKRRMKDLGLR
jgi:two-component system nitrogen regulation response regulator GlnG